ncbi:glycosyltransferase [Litorihabitans aurantiacus]|uniref:D-inositol 3-phosphate glycosyltransferase n=1 Tax=Litorihabitans aurantiacus TaxID=1930061 RepID=A0AA37XF31_9MICO|nr:glycosyltransferase [Litorihabitans aurantiacus]GMA31845.1 hypothetical protein GCM10025875_18370 [Litorihabitans aurantiacus]
MRILHVSQPVTAGVAGVVADLVRAQVARGHVVDVACPAPSPLAEAAAGAGARVRAWTAGREPGPGVAREWLALRRIVADSRPDVVVLHSAKAGLVGRLRRLGPPVVHVPHAWSFEAVCGLTARAARTWETLAGRRTDRLVCVSLDELDRGRRAGVGTRADVVGNGVDLTAFAPAPREGSEDPAVVCVGRLTRQKGQDLLLRAWPRVLDAVPHASLVLVGDGPDAAALADSVERIARSRHDGDARVSLLGAQDVTAATYTDADVVVLPSRWEGMSLVVAEAMACARPVVAFDVDGVAELLGDGGVVVPSDDVAALAEALTPLLRDRVAAAALGRAGRARVERVADVRTTLERWDEVLRAVVEERAGHVRRTDEARLASVPVASVLAQLLGGAYRDADVACVDGRRSLDRARAVVLSTLGVPVHWLGHGRLPMAPGAPVAGPEAQEAQIAEMVARAGTTTDPVAVAGPPVSVVVTTLDEGEAAAVLVRAVLAQLRADDELVLVDGGSRDGSIEALPSDPRLRVVVQDGAGISEGRNVGIDLAAHEVIVCTDAGCAPDPGFVEAFRRAFAVADPPALASGLYRATARNPIERAQALACYPQPDQVRRPSLAVRLYTRVFGTGYDPRFAIGRCVAFTRSAWREVGGFPEHLPTGEDVSFGLAVAARGRVVACRDAAVDWGQRDGVAATWRMYRAYGRASTDGGDLRLLARDGLRASAYAVAPLLLASRGGRPLALLGAAAYLSLPVARALRSRERPAVLAAIPLALAVKDVGKLVGALQGAARARRRRTVRDRRAGT